MSGGGLTNSGVIDLAAGDDAECAPDDVCQRDDVCGDGHDDDAGTTTVTATNLNLTLPAVLTSLLAGPGKRHDQCAVHVDERDDEHGRRHITGGVGPDADDADAGTITDWSM